jgi:hypothetical protein
MKTGDRPHHRVFNALTARPVLITDINRKASTRTLDNRRMIKQCSDPFDIERGRHHKDTQVLAKRRLNVERQRKAEIGIQRPLVEFVEDDGGDSGELGIIEDHTGEDALGDNLDPRPGRYPVIQAHAVTDRFAHLLAEQGRHAARRGTCRQPARFQQDDLPFVTPGLAKEMKRYQRRFAGAWRSRKHGSLLLAKRRADIRQHMRNRKLRQRRRRLHFRAVTIS